jgi:hypothetical protein
MFQEYLKKMIKEDEDRKGHRITIQFDTDNADFDEDEGAAIKDILKQIITNVPDGKLNPDQSDLRDHNGNKIGGMSIR